MYLVPLKVKCIQEVDEQMAQKKVRSQHMERVEDLAEFPEYFVWDIRNKQIVDVDVGNADLVLEEFLAQF